MSTIIGRRPEGFLLLGRIIPSRSVHTTASLSSQVGPSFLIFLLVASVLLIMSGVGQRDQSKISVFLQLEQTDKGVSGVQGSVIPAPARSGVQASLRKGAGGRNSFSGVVCTVFGATGFAGKYVASRLGKIGCQIIFPYRCDAYYVKELKQVGDLGQTLFFPFDLKDEASIRKVVKYSNVVINMIGRDFSTTNYSYDDVNAHGARRLARICKEMGVEKFIQVSALNASLNPPEHIVPGGSRFLQSKGLGEQMVREEFPEAIIVRPAWMYGDSPDRFLKIMTWFGAKYFNRQYDVYRGGEETVKMPLYGPNMADGIEKCVMDPTLVGQTVEFVGPYAYKFSDLHDYIFYRSRMGDPIQEENYRRRTGFSPMMQWKINVADRRTHRQAIKPFLHWELIENLHAQSDILTGVPTMTDIGVRNLKTFEFASRWHLDIEYCWTGYLVHEFDKFRRPPFPPRVPPVYSDEALKRRRKYRTNRRIYDENTLQSSF